MYDKKNYQNLEIYEILWPIEQLLYSYFFIRINYYLEVVQIKWIEHAGQVCSFYVTGLRYT